MNTEARKENILTLENLLGLSLDRCEKVVASTILITGCKSYPVLSGFLKELLARSFESVETENTTGKTIACEVIIGNAKNVTSGPLVYLGETNDFKLVCSFSKPAQTLQKIHPAFIYLLLSCYASAIIFKKIIGENHTFPSDEEIIIDPKLIIPNPDIFNTTINIGECYLAGAGAIGNAFLYALSNFFVQGTIHVTDPDFVSGRNLNRCLFFNTNEIKQNKAEILVSHAQPLFKNVKLNAVPDRCQSVGETKLNERNWLKKLIIGVDSRRARRKIQEEIPGEVFDGSTTGIEEIVIHYHKQPVNGNACLCCIYNKEEREQAREQHIAEALGVTLQQVTQLCINETAALAICSKYSNYQVEDLVGIPYDTLFKELCGEGKLKTAEDKQVLAPLSFVSVLAGTMLALMFVQQHVEKSLPYNYWRLSPWKKLNFRLQQMKPTNPECEFCNDDLNLEVATNIWSENGRNNLK